MLRVVIHSVSGADFTKVLGLTLIRIFLIKTINPTEVISVPMVKPPKKGMIFEGLESAPDVRSYSLVCNELIALEKLFIWLSRASCLCQKDCMI